MCVYTDKRALSRGPGFAVERYVCRRSRGNFTNENRVTSRRAQPTVPRKFRICSSFDCYRSPTIVSETRSFRNDFGNVNRPRHRSDYGFDFDANFGFRLVRLVRGVGRRTMVSILIIERRPRRMRRNRNAADFNVFQNETF